jgi:hypothetical protein
MATSPLDERSQLPAALALKETLAAARRLNEQLEQLALLLFPDDHPPPLRVGRDGDDA